MKGREVGIALIFFIFVAALFFYKIFFQGLVPFPGDLLISEYNPWKTYSYLGYVPGSFPNKAQYFDTIRQLYPWKTLAIDFIKTGQIPLWNPYNFSGSPLLANFQSALFYPLNILHLVFSQITVWSILIILQPLLASFFTYLFARKIGIGKVGSSLASIAFSYSLFMTVFLEYNTIGHALVWLPLSLYLVEKLLEKLSPWRIIVFVLSIVSSFLSGHLQIFGFSFLFIFIYIVYRIVFQEWPRRKKLMSLITFLTLLILSLGISSIQLFPTLELLNFSARVAQSYQFLIEKLLIQPYQAILFLSPDFFGNPVTRNYLIPDTYPGNALYIGLIPFIFSLFTIINLKKNRYLSFFLAISFILLLFLIRTPFTEIFYRLQIPFFSTGSPTNAIFLLSFSLSILSGFGLEKYLTKKHFFYRLILLFLGGLFSAFWLVVFTLHPSIISTKNFLYSTGLFILFAVLFFASDFFKKQKRTIVFLFLLLTIFDLFYFFQKFNPFVRRELVFPSAPIFEYLKDNAGINRFWGYGTAAVEANFATQYSLFSPDGYDPLYPARYGEFIQSSKDGKIQTQFTNQTRSDAIITPGYGEKDLSGNTYRLRILDLIGVKYVLDRAENRSTEKTFPQDRFKLIYEQDGWKIFENRKAAPRAFLTTNYQTFKTNEEFEKLFFSDRFDPTKKILLEEEVMIGPGPIKGNAGLISYKPNSVMFQTESNIDSLLFLSDTYYPGWKAFIEPSMGSGQVETKIYRANYAFRAVLVPSGNHMVTFKYQPQSFFLGLKTTIISLILLVGLVFVLIWRKKRIF